MFELAGKKCLEGQKTTVVLKAGSREDGSPIEIPTVVLAGARPGPTLLLTALLHGTELPGADTIRQVLEQVDPSALAGRVICIPVANPLAFLEHEQSSLRDGLNMNRVFPGQASGSITQRMAHVIYTHCVKAADAVIDFHTNAYPAMHWVIAKTAGDDLGARTEALARAFGLTLGRYSRTRERQMVGTLVDSALELGKPGIIVEITAHMMLLAEPVAAAVRGTLNVMKRLGMLTGDPDPQHGVTVIPEGFTTNNRLRANAGGLVHHLKSPGARVRVGDIVALVRTPLGEIAEEIRSPVDGFILSFPRHRNQAVMSGDHVAFIASTDS
jgi:hypothetical protein